MVCDTCVHNEICIHEQNLRKKLKELDIKVEPPLTVTFSCVHYRSDNKAFEGYSGLANLCSTNDSIY